MLLTRLSLILLASLVGLVAAAPAGPLALNKRQQCPAPLQACGPACYDPAKFACTGTTLCPKVLKACGSDCYDPAALVCSDGKLGPINGGGGGGGSAENCGPGTKPCGAACYDPSTLTCTGSTLCPIALSACGTDCYDPKALSCTDGKLVPISGGGGGGGTGSGSPAECPVGERPCTDELGAPVCYNPDQGDYHCVQNVLMQGPALNIFGESAPIHDADSEPVVGEGKRKIQLVNRCEFDVWVGFEGKPLPLDGGIGLGAGKQLTVKVDEQWTAGRIWGRTGCFKSGDKIRCATGDCGNPANKYKLQCGGQGAMKPTTLAEFTLNGYKGTDYYDISNVDGYNIGIMIQAIGGKAADGVEDQYNCKPVSCNMDMGACPSELMVTNEDGSLSCASISTAVNLPLSRRANPFLDQIFKDADKRALVMCDCACGENCGCESPDSKYCCSPYNEPTPIENGGKCYVEQWPTSPFAFGSMDKRYDQVFKSQCPMAYSWQFDDHRSLIQCLEAEYAVTFCPDPKYNKDASGAALPRENTSDVFDDSDWFYLYEDDWDESLLDGFETKLNLEHKIDDAYDDDLSTFIAKKALEKALFPITTYRMALLGYIRAAEALKVFIAQLFKANPGELYDAQGKTLEEIEKSIHHEMYRDPGNSMFDCRDSDDDKHTCPKGENSVEDWTDLNWKQKEDTNFKGHLFRELQIAPQFLTTKTLRLHKVRGRGEVFFKWHGMFGIATNTDQSYFGDRSLRLYRKVIYEQLQPELKKFLDSGKAGKYFKCNGGACGVFKPDSAEDVQVTLEDEEGFLEALGDELELDQQAIAYDGSKREEWIDDAIAKSCNIVRPTDPPGGRCVPSDWLFTVYYSGMPTIDSDNYPPSPADLSKEFLESSAEKMKFLRETILSHDPEEIINAIVVAVTMVSTGNQIVDQIKEYMDSVDDGREEEAQEALAAGQIFKTIMEFAIETAIFAMLPGAGPILQVASKAWTAIRTSTRVASVANKAGDLKGMVKLVETTAKLSANIKKLSSGIKEALPAWTKKAIEKASKSFEKVRGPASCFVAEEGLEAAYGVPIEAAIKAVMRRRDDESVVSPGTAFAGIDSQHLALEPHWTTYLEKRADKRDKCILDWTQTDDFRVDFNTGNPCKELGANKLKFKPLCAKKVTLADGDKLPDVWWEELEAWPSDNGVPSPSKTALCPDGTHLECDHVLELDEFKEFCEQPVLEEIRRDKKRRDKFCEAWNKLSLDDDTPMSEAIFNRLNGKDNLRALHAGVHTVKTSEVRRTSGLIKIDVTKPSGSKTAPNYNTFIKYMADHEAQDFRTRTIDDLSKILGKMPSNDPDIDITRAIQQWSAAKKATPEQYVKRIQAALDGKDVPAHTSAKRANIFVEHNMERRSKNTKRLSGSMKNCKA